MKNKILLATFIGIFILSLALVNAVEIQQASLPQPLTQGLCGDLSQTCTNCTFVNITSILYPDNVKHMTNYAMVQNGTEYTYNFCDTALSGDYSYNTLGDPDGILVSQPVSFKVSPTGVNQNSILENPLLLILVFISLVLLILAIVMSNPSLGFISGIMFTLSGIYTMIYGLNNSTDMYTRAIGLVLIGLGTIFIIASAYEWMKDSQNDETYYGSSGSNDED
jgi:hypothetical protein